MDRVTYPLDNQRQIEFVKNSGKWQVFHRDLNTPLAGPEEILPAQITVEFASTTSKMLAMQSARFSGRFQKPREEAPRAFTDLGLKEKDRIIRELNPQGGRRIEIENSLLPGGAIGVKLLNIFDPR